MRHRAFRIVSTPPRGLAAPPSCAATSGVQPQDALRRAVLLPPPRCSPLAAHCRHRGLRGSFFRAASAFRPVPAPPPYGKDGVRCRRQGRAPPLSALRGASASVRFAGGYTPCSAGDSVLRAVAVSHVSLRAALLILPREAFDSGALRFDAAVALHDILPCRARR